MNNLWRFINKYSALFLFTIFFIFSIVLIIRNNDFQRVSTLNTSNEWIGKFYTQVNNITKYIQLDEVNKQLVAENTLLRNQLKNAYFDDSLVLNTVNDTINRVQYQYISAEVVNKSVNARNNYITINRGSKHGIKKGMGVVCPTGVVGIVWNVSPDFASIQSVLHEDTKITSSIEGTPYFGPLLWDGENPNVATLADIPNQINLKKGTKISTSGLSVTFPKGIAVGKVLKAGVKGGGSFLSVTVQLATNFYALQYVYVIKNTFAPEQQNLENLNKKPTDE
ncbi:MAG: rod shape-determining protein MreC [Sphingobacteriales bacterium]|nr:MAG: rod shape-determining protein MreC [Sphingobacteriales bacterium]TAF80978.1 MAG: rod shape-determining protein MreC [Sphingobacteriales bacterium]